MNKMKMLVVLVVAALCCSAIAKNKKSEDNKIKIALYYESLCPDSKRFITQQLAPVWHEFRGIVKVKMVPYGKSTRENVNGKWQFTCHHGPEECYGNKVQSCVLKDLKLLATDKMEVIICLMSQVNPDKALDMCLMTVTKFERADKIKECAAGDQGSILLASNGNKTDDIQRPLSFVPTIVMNEKFNQTIHEQAYSNLKEVICRLAVNKPPVC